MARDYWLGTFSTKCQFVIFHRSRANLSSLRLQVNKGTIPVSSKVRYLGMYLDARLRWTDHINFLRTRSSKYMIDDI